MKKIMHEILFRGKRVDNGEWAYGYYVNCARPRGPKDHTGHYIVTYPSNPEDYHEIYTGTVGQYTGLTDKNGTAIFEGDIVDFFGMRGEIVRECGAFGIVTKQIDYDLLESKIPFHNSANFCFNDNFISLWELWWNYEQDDNPLYEVEVIGNIYDTLELL